MNVKDRLFLGKFFQRVATLLWVIVSFPFLCNASGLAQKEAEKEALYTPVILLLDEGASITDLEAAGIIIWGHREDMALALLPRGEASMYSSKLKEKKVLEVERSRRNFPVMDIAKTYCDAFMMHEGIKWDQTAEPVPYTGKGVVTGLVDIGMDPGHIEFRDAEGNLRVKKTVWLDELHGERKIADNPEDILALGADTGEEYHGTHVAGIMAGSYKGNGYWGMAPDSEIVMTSSRFYDAGILAGCEEIISYAKSVGRPAVINLSLSGYTGPHDGTSLFCRYMNLLSQDAIVCLAAGNEGNKPGTYQGVLGEGRQDWRACIEGEDYVHFDIYGYSEVWSDDERQFTFRWLLYDTHTWQTLWQSEEYGMEGEFDITIESARENVLKDYLIGGMSARGGINSLNGRWCVEMDYDCRLPEPAPGTDGKWARYRLGFEVRAKSGETCGISAYSDCQYSHFRKYADYPEPNSEMSVSDLVTGQNVLCVGMYGNRSSVPVIGGGDRDIPVVAGEVSKYSSYGILGDGRVMPHTVAPGAGVISSVNSHLIAQKPELAAECCAEVEENGKLYYWINTTGTSMASPYVAGAVAAWLEGAPELKGEDVINIILATNRAPFQTPENPRNGNGYFDPCAGLRMAVGASAVVPGVGEKGKMAWKVQGRTAELFNPSGATVRAVAITADGIEYPLTPYGGNSSSGIEKFDLGKLPGGLYFLVAISEGTGTPEILKVHLR